MTIRNSGRFRAFSSAALLFVISTMHILVGCNKKAEPPSQVNWLPMMVGGPQDIRPIPAANKVAQDYKEWVQGDPSPKIRLYSIELAGASNQINLSVNSFHGDTPLGARMTMTGSFVYRSPTNGDYFLKWSCRSPDETNNLRIGDAPRRALLQPLEIIRESGIPVFRIVAIEGVEPRGSVVADRGENALLE